MDAIYRALFATCLFVATAGSAVAAPATNTSSVTLTWTATGDDGHKGTASRYDLRYSLAPITATNFAKAKHVTGVPRPTAGGSRQQATVSGLETNRGYYFAIKAADEAGNWSPLSNVAFFTTPALTQATPLFPSSLSLSPPFPSPARDHVRFNFALPRAMDVRVVVMDVSGRQLKWLAVGPYPAGTTELQWNLTDDAGARLSTGLYWVFGVFGTTRIIQRLTVVR